MEQRSLILAGAAAIVVLLAAFVALLRRLKGSTPPGLSSLAAGPGERSKTQSKIERIKRYRQEHGVGLKEAKDAIEALDASHQPITHSAAAKDVEALVASGHLIEAIKVYRERTGCGLKEAKDAIERMRDG